MKKENCGILHPIPRPHGTHTSYVYFLKSNKYLESDTIS